jgi:SPW repeat-containing protein
MMLKSLSTNNRTAFDIVNVVAGLGLFLSPWLFGFSAEAYAAWNAWIVGAAIAVIAAAALYAFYEAEEWVNLVLGIWALIAPWVLGFSAVAAAMWVHVIAGIVVAALAAGNIWFSHNRPFSAA